MPAVMIRQLEALEKIIEYTSTGEQRELLLAQAAMIFQSSEESIPEPADRADVKREYDGVIDAAARVGALHAAQAERRETAGGQAANR